MLEHKPRSQFWNDQQDSKPTAAAAAADSENDENFDPELLNMEQMFFDMFNVDNQPDAILALHSWCSRQKAQKTQTIEAELRRHGA